MKIKSLLIFCSIFLLACAEEKTPSFTDSSLYVFGDSLSDIGNANIASGGLLPDKNYYQGRFSNGPLYVEKLAVSLNTQIKPSRSYGTNFAFAGATSVAVSAQVFNYSENVAGQADPEAVYILWTGANDLLGILQTDAATVDVTDVISIIRQSILDLSNIGAENIIILNQVNIGKLPRTMALETQVPGTVLAADTLTRSFNTALDAMLDLLETEESIVTIRFDVFTLFEQVMDDPVSFGLSNITEACYVRDETRLELSGNETICTSPSEYLFWDSIHPTSAAHEIIFQRIQSLLDGV